MHEIPLEEGNRHQPPVATLADDDVVLRQFACPGCGRLLDNEVRRAAEAPLWDFRLRRGCEVYYLGVDIGGTFTDVVSVDDAGRVRSTKVSSTPPRFERGFMEGVNKLAGLHETTGADAFLRDCEIVLHGTTVGDQRAGRDARRPKVGVMTTRGHRDTLPVMRAAGAARACRSSRCCTPRATASRDPIVPAGADPGGQRAGGPAGRGRGAAQRRRGRSRRRRAGGRGRRGDRHLLAVVGRQPRRTSAASAMVVEMAPGVYVTCSHEAHRASGRVRAHRGHGDQRLHRARDRRATCAASTRARRAADDGGPLLIMQAAGGVVRRRGAPACRSSRSARGRSAGLPASAVLAGRRASPT